LKQAAQDLTKESRQRVLLLQHRANTLMDEKKKLRAQSQQADVSSALKWKDAEQRIDEVETKMEDMKKLLATETMLRKKADRSVKFLRAQIIQIQKDSESKNSIVDSKVQPVDKLRPTSSAARRPHSACSQRSSASEESSTRSSTKSSTRSSSQSGSRR
jgi:hypothetical protein